MYFWREIKSSIHRRYIAILTVMVTATGVVACLIAFQLFRQVGELANDQKITQVLSTSLEAFLQVRRERHALAEILTSLCAANPGLKDCQAPAVNIKPDLSNDCQVHGDPWLNEHTLCAGSALQKKKFAFAWTDLRGPYEAVKDVLETRDHLDLVKPQLQRAFAFVFGISLTLFILIGLFACAFMVRSTSRKIASLVTYTKQIGRGDFSMPPKETNGTDEVGVLAGAMETMVKDLIQTRERLLLTERLNSWQEAARRVAHELKNPLTPIQLVGEEIMIAAASTTDPLRKTLERCSNIVLDEVQSLLRMVKEFVTFGRLPRPEVQLGDLIEVIADFETRVQLEENVVLLVKKDSSSLEVLSDRRMILQILDNLLNNAKAASLHTHVNIVIQTSVSSQGFAQLDFSDDGPGIPDVIRDRVFEPYVTTSPREQSSTSSGLGLAIARKIAIDHGGSLELFDTGTHGTTFRLRLPLIEI